PAPEGNPSRTETGRAARRSSNGIRDLHRRTDLLHRRTRHLARAAGSRAKDVPDRVRPGRELGAPGVDPLQTLQQVVDELALAVQAPDARRPAALGRPLLRLFRREGLVQVEDGTDVGVAGIRAALARGIRDHGLDLLAHDV